MILIQIQSVQIFISGTGTDNYNSHKTKGQTMIYKTLHRKLKVEQHMYMYTIYMFNGLFDMLSL